MIITATGWLWSEVDTEMDMRRFTSLYKYWMDFPPPHLSLAGIAGALSGKPAGARREAQEEEEFNPGERMRPSKQSDGAMLGFGPSAPFSPKVMRIINRPLKPAETNA